MSRSSCLALLVAFGVVGALMSGCTKTPEQEQRNEVIQSDQTREVEAEQAQEESAEQEQPVPQTPTEEKSLPDQWAEKAYVVVVRREEGEVLARSRREGKISDVIRIGTIQSWAHETTLDQFASRVGKYARAMSDVTGKPYCGHICSAPNTEGRAPWSIDILTLSEGGYCPLIPVCSVPNGSGISPYGEPVGVAVYINILPVAAMTEEGQGMRASQPGNNFELFTRSGQRIAIDPQAGRVGYYYMMDPHTLGFAPVGEVPREVFNYQTNQAAQNSTLEN